jgi:crotonobetainyl-CoA:carnitine CoA-transferase CaiB-like acyl-CoA transferase
VRVLLTGTSIPARWAAAVLAQFGAQVRRLEEAAAERGETGVDPWESADVVLVDRVEAVTDLPGLGAACASDYLELVAELNRGVWVSASAYGLTTSRADAIASDTTILAAGGILGHSRVATGLAPTIPAGSIGLKIVGDVMALAALHGLHQRLAGDRPVHLDVSAQAAIIATGLTLEMAHALLECPNDGGSARYGAPTGFFECLVGAVYVVVLEQHQWAGFQASLAPLLDDVATIEQARSRADEVNAALAKWASTRTVEECEKTLQAAGVACTAVNSVRELVTRARVSGRPFEMDEAVPMPALISQAPVVAGSADRIRSLDTVRILDAGHVLAAPLATSWLAAMGAEVVKLEDPDRLDVYRRRGPFAKGVEGLNRSAYFNAINYSKTGTDVRISADERAAVGEFDAIVHNLSPNRAVQVGVDGRSVLGLGRPALVIESSGFGNSGDWAGYRAYGHNIHAFAGLVAATRNARGHMADVGTPWCDPLTSVAIATWVCAWALAPSKETATAVDLSMSELLSSQLIDLIDVEPEVTYRPRPDRRDLFVRIDGAEPLVAVSLVDGGQQARFEAAVGLALAPQTRGGEIVDIQGDGLTPEGLESALLGRGLAVAIVRRAEDLARDPFLRSTGLFVAVESADLGSYDIVGLPWTIVGAAATTLRAAPERPVRS